MEINVGEYVRTVDGDIRKIDKIEKCEICKENLYINIEIIKDLHFTNSYHTKDIAKHSKNIIDLIEVGDVGKFFMEYDGDNEDTNIFEIVGKTSDNKELCVITSDYQIDCFPVENLREILTHEQFEQNAYRLEEK